MGKDINKSHQKVTTTNQPLTLHIPDSGWQQLPCSLSTDGVSTVFCSPTLAEVQHQTQHQHSPTHRSHRDTNDSPHSCTINPSWHLARHSTSTRHQSTPIPTIDPTAVLHGTPEHVTLNTECCCTVMNWTAVVWCADVSEIVSLKTDIYLNPVVTIAVRESRHGLKVKIDLDWTYTT
jgi:hypothetical protein